MSTTDCQTSNATAIPSSRTVAIHDAEHMPQDYSTTPGGTFFSTTPGGTRIIYDRKFLLGCRTSPLAKTPPQGLPDIPGVTSPPSAGANEKKASDGELLNSSGVAACNTTGDDAQFEMDI
ncbi:eukaryotic translation initiation factor 4E-binding protein 1 [Phycodurus eques]|uniref:eukaryotic translation initiation factor 4E-binding protein 1 n=1 Tax=Phycodurus eques TaxID=693459 RepID=UPI002ACE93CC|nr:eukaryotic translation initiation factor 4E-binding protein 1 [Phycodurus eques]